MDLLSTWTRKGEVTKQKTQFFINETDLSNMIYSFLPILSYLSFFNPSSSMKLLNLI